MFHENSDHMNFSISHELVNTFAPRLDLLLWIILDCHFACIVINNFSSYDYDADKSNLLLRRSFWQ